MLGEKHADKAVRAPEEFSMNATKLGDSTAKIQRRRSEKHCAFAMATAIEALRNKSAGGEKTYTGPGFSVKLTKPSWPKAGTIFTMSSEIEQLEQQLDSFDAAQRHDALAKLWDLAESGKIALAELGGDVNLHVHTFFSYNA